MKGGAKRSDELSVTKRALLELRQLRAKLEQAERAKTEPIAIVGLSCRFPGGASGLDEYWRLLETRQDAVREVPSDRWDIDAYYDPNPEAAGKMYTRRAAFMDGVDRFDPLFFGISPREATGMDPQQRLLLEVCWEALENAGLGGGRRGREVGVFVGLSTMDYLIRRLRGGDEIDPYTMTGTSFSTAVGRVSYVLGLEGPSVAVDAACSSSLAALHLACQSLRTGETRAALVGSVNLLLAPEPSVAFSRLRVLAADGRCKSFDADADGYGRGEGCGVVVLKRLSDATADKDTILAVVKGTAVNHDGRSSSLTAPRGPTQEAVVRSALSQAGVEPEKVTYVEAHGTGTILGDSIEVGVLGGVMGQGRDGDRRLAIGSVKGNFGHLEAAAGIAGLIKVVLALQHEELPAQLNLAALNPTVSLEESLVAIPGVGVPWPATDEPRVASVHSFGINGTNAHAVIQEAPRAEAANGDDEAKSAPERPVHVLTLSARDTEALAKSAQRHARHLAERPATQLSDLCYSTNVGRDHFRHRLAVVATGAAEARERLEAAARGEASPAVLKGKESKDTKKKIAFVFSAHGSQYAGMGRQLYEHNAAFAATLDRCAEHVKQWDVPLLDALFEDLDADKRVAFGQPALFALQVALFELWRSWGIRPHAVLGQGVGEYAAAYAAGVFELEDALGLVVERARLIQSLEGEDVESSPEVEPILDALQKAADAVKSKPARLRFISGVTGEEDREGVATAAYWRRQAREPMRFAEGLKTLHDGGYRLLVEVGPDSEGQSLLDTGAQGDDDEGDAIAWLPTLRQGDEWQVTLQSLGRLYVEGAEVNWGNFDQGYTRRRVALPSYPFRKERYWAVEKRAPAPPPVARESSAQSAQPDAESSLTDWLFEPRWFPSAHVPSEPSVDGDWLLLVDSGGTGEALAAELSERGASCVIARAGTSFERVSDGEYRVDPASASDMEQLLEAAGKSLRGVVHLWHLDAPGAEGLDAEAIAEGQRLCSASLLHLTQGLLGADSPRLCVVTRQAHRVGDARASVSPLQGLAWGFRKVVTLEHPELRCVCIDLDDSGSDPIGELASEVAGETSEEEVAFRGGQRHVARLVRVTAPARDQGGALIRSDGTYLITGGLGALGLYVARWIVEHGGRNLALMGRRSPSDEASAAIAELEQQGAKVTVVQADVSDHESLARALADLSESTPALRGVVHAAGVLEDGPLRELTWERFEKVLAPKTIGAWNLHSLTSDSELDFFVLYSSLASVLGSHGQVNYAAANAFLDSLAHHRHSQGQSAAAVNWGAWQEAGMAAKAARGVAVEKRWANIGLHTFSPKDGLEALRQVLRRDVAQVAVMPVEMPTLLSVLGKRPLFQELAKTEAVAAAEVGTGGGATDEERAAFEQRFRAAYPDPAGIRLVLVDLVSFVASKLLGFDPARPPERDAELSELGADSVTNIELRNILSQEVGSALPADLLLTHTTIDAVAGYLLEPMTAEIRRRRELAIAEIKQSARGALDKATVPLVIIAVLVALLFGLRYCAEPVKDLRKKNTPRSALPPSGKVGPPPVAHLAPVAVAKSDHPNER